MSFKGKYVSTKELFENFKIMDFDKNYIYKIGIFMYKLDTKLLSYSVLTIFSVN